MPRHHLEIPDRTAEALFGSTRRSVLALLFDGRGEAFYLRQIARLTGRGVGAVQRELRQLATAGLILRDPRGTQVYFSANRDAPVYQDLVGLVVKTAGLADVLRSELAPLAEKTMINIAFLYGSVASARHGARSDVDLMIIGSVTLSDLIPLLKSTQDRLGREVNPTVYTPKEFRQKARAGQHFVTRLLERPRIMLIGSNDELAKLVGKPVAHNTSN